MACLKVCPLRSVAAMARGPGRGVGSKEKKNDPLWLRLKRSGTLFFFVSEWYVRSGWRDDDDGAGGETLFVR